MRTLQSHHSAAVLRSGITAAAADVIRGRSFRKVVAELEGYDASGMGEVVREA